MNDTSFENCIKCTVCTTACPVSRVNPGYPGPKQAGPDGERLRLKDGALYDEALKYCINCKRCEVACPSDVNETVSALMNATPGRDLCWLLTRHPEKPEYHVVLCVRQEYFDGPELDRLILDAWSNVLGFASPGEAAPYQKQITRDVVLDSRSPDCEDILKDLIWAFSDFARDRRGVCDPEARCLAGNPGYPGSAGPF